MTNTFKTTLGLTAFAGVLATLSLAAAPANASVQSELHRCTSSSFGKTVNCCEAVMDKAVWQVGISAKNCEKSVSCRSVTSKRRCVVIIKTIYPRPQWTYDRNDLDLFKGSLDVKSYSRRGGKSFN